MAKPPREMLSVLLRSGDGRVVPTNQQEAMGMEATVEAPSAQTRKDYTSRPGALSRFSDLTKSREQWRIRAERAGEQITTLEVEIAELRARLAALGGVKKNNGPLDG